MKAILTWIDELPLGMLVLIAVLLGLAPFHPEPHLWEKLKMLATGTLSRPIDIFDLFLHSTPVALLITKLVRMTQHTNQNTKQKANQAEPDDVEKN
jgi:hypothetical protein